MRRCPRTWPRCYELLQHERAGDRPAVTLADVVLHSRWLAVEQVRVVRHERDGLDAVEVVRLVVRPQLVTRIPRFNLLAGDGKEDRRIAAGCDGVAGIAGDTCFPVATHRRAAHRSAGMPARRSAVRRART